MSTQHEIVKNTTETYSLRGDKCLWAKINLDINQQSVNVMISSDYGSYNYYWTHCGISPKKFLISLDMHYAMKKLMGGTDNLYQPDWESRSVSLKKIIIEARRDNRLSKDEAKKAWREIVDIMHDSNDENLYYERIWHHELADKLFYDMEDIPADTKLKSSVTDFWEDIWIPFTKYLKTEIEQEKIAS